MEQNKVYNEMQKKGDDKAWIQNEKARIARKRVRLAKLRINGLTMESLGKKIGAKKSEVSLACNEKQNTPKARKIRKIIDALPLQSQLIDVITREGFPGENKNK